MKLIVAAAASLSLVPLAGVRNDVGRNSRKTGEL